MATLRDIKSGMRKKEPTKAVVTAEADQLWYKNIPNISESPYVVTYQEEDFKQIEKMQNDEEKAINDYWQAQPEVHEDAFKDQLHKALEKSPHTKVIYIWELAKYRLNKKISNSLSFEEKKELLINSEEWNGWIHQNNNHLSADELTEANIQDEINVVGTCWGMEIMKKLR